MKKVIFIHGLNSKPPKEDLFKFWKQCLLKNLELTDSSIQLEDSMFSMVYWANEIPNHLEDENINEVQQSIDKMLNKREEVGDKLHNGKLNIIGGVLAETVTDVVSMLSGALTIKDNVLESYLQEINYYQNDQYIADKIRNHLEDEIIKAWEEGNEIAIISHSMGTFIAYDVLWRFSRKNLPKYKKYHTKKIPLFITMGSPLGEKGVKKLLFADDHKDERKYPSNIKRWYNFSCTGDVVSHDSTLEDDFCKDMKNKDLLEKYRDYINLQNIYRNPKNKLNPHKSFGYLIQPKLAEVLIEFFKS